MMEEVVFLHKIHFNFKQMDLLKELFEIVF